MVVIPGLGGDAAQFAPLVAELSSSFRVLIFDPRGGGRSDKPEAPYSIEMMADDAAGLMDALDVTSAHVFGFSMGGRIALSLALDHPARVESLVLAGTSARTVERWPARLLRVATDRVPRLGALDRFDPRPVGAYLRQQRAWRAFDCSARLGEIRVPTLILHSRDDEIVPYARAREMQAAITGSRLVGGEGGHLFVVAAATPRVASDVRGFVASL